MIVKNFIEASLGAHDPPSKSLETLTAFRRPVFLKFLMDRTGARLSEPRTTVYPMVNGDPNNWR